MLYAGRKLTALEACACGLVSHTFWPTSFMQEVVPRVQRIAAQSGKVSSLIHRQAGRLLGGTLQVTLSSCSLEVGLISSCKHYIASSRIVLGQLLFHILCIFLVF